MSAGPTSGDEASAIQAVEATVFEHPFLAGLQPAHLRVLADNALRMHYETGTTIFREGDPANRFYLIERGRVSLESRRQDEPPRIPATARAQGVAPRPETVRVVRKLRERGAPARGTREIGRVATDAVRRSARRVPPDGAGVDPPQADEAVQQRRLARRRRPDDEHALPCPERERERREHLDPHPAAAETGDVRLGQAAGGEEE